VAVVELPVDVGWVVGFLLALIRVGAFVIASPIIGRSIPAPGRMAFAFAVSMAMTRPIPGLIELGDLVAAAGINVAVGATLGWVSGLIMHLFSSAGAVADLVSGLSVSMVFDPMQGSQGGVFSRMFNLTATTMFLVAGGMGILVGGLVSSATLLPVDAGLAPDPALGGYIIESANLMIRRSVELALPIMGVLLMMELALGLAARFAPQANIFLLGLPAKLLVSITVVGSAWVLFPDAMADAEGLVARGMQAGIRGLGG
jgi:flagellar biosynthesis protein FliR